jgi:hypothetical protein
MRNVVSVKFWVRESEHGWWLCGLTAVDSEGEETEFVKAVATEAEARAEAVAASTSFADDFGGRFKRVK